MACLVADMALPFFHGYQGFGAIVLCVSRSGYNWRICCLSDLGKVSLPGFRVTLNTNRVLSRHRVGSVGSVGFVGSVGSVGSVGFVGFVGFPDFCRLFLFSFC